MKTINWGIIGLGKIANKFAEDLALCENANLQAVASRSLEKAKQFATTHNSAKYYHSYQELANDENVDIVYVATPHVFHFENTMMFLKANKSVLCEKAFAINENEVNIMIEEARKRKLFLMEALWTRFIPATEKLIELINNKTIGNIESISADFGFAAEFNPDKRLFNKNLGGGSLLDIGIYPIYISLLLLGLPQIIKAKARMTKEQIDSFCEIIFQYQNGEKAMLESSFETTTPTQAIIQGSNGKILMHSRFHQTEKLSIFKSDNTIKNIEMKFTGNYVVFTKQ